jgi:MoaA/NifB/PqqE/SkfB family radical SAM enzyme
MLPWIHLSTRPNGLMRLCCTTNASSVGATNDKEFGGEVGILKENSGARINLGKVSLEEAWNGPFMRQTRKMMLEGKWPASCLKCKKEEEAGAQSKRIWETAYWSERFDCQDIISETREDGSTPTKLRYLDLRLGSKCNLKCIMCSPHDSSAWVGDWEKLYPQIENPELKELMGWNYKDIDNTGSYTWHKDNPRFWEELYAQLPHIYQLYFAGGEPLLIEEHFEILDECIKRGYAKQIELRYNSNGTVINDKILSLWEQFRRVRFHVSIDSVKEMNTYIRYPTPWKKIETNMKILDQTSDKIEVTVACAVQALNIHYIPELIQWKLDQNFKKVNPWPLGAGLINFHLVYHPPIFNVKVLPMDFKNKTLEKINNFSDELLKRNDLHPEFAQSPYGIKRLKSLTNFMMSEDWSRRLPQLKEYLFKLDGLRKTDFNKTFPEMQNIFQSASDITTQL